MGNLVAIVSIILALFAAGCIVYIARELTSNENLPDAPEERRPGRTLPSGVRCDGVQDFF